MSSTDRRATRDVKKWTLRTAFRHFWGHPSPWILCAGLIATWAFRIYLGDWMIWDLAIVIAIVAAWPFVEWVIHVFVLHFKPFELAGRTIDPYLARKHRDHHQEPDHLPDVFIPLRSLLLFIPGALLISWLLTPDPVRLLTLLAALFTMGMVYEWSHFLIHTNYRPKTKLFKKLWRHHRLHHFKHEKNWFGVSMTLGDKVLGTAPDFREIETSDNCRDLGV